MSTENQKELILIVDYDPRLRQLLLEYPGEQRYVVYSVSNPNTQQTSTFKPQ
ncbi:MAG: hypothetical protein KAJ95_02820 [Gammaproteobacteria bacterium]|nr:hypothetical protein [Gammaproteobacteria bacterium]